MRGWVSGGQVGEVGWVGDWLERLGKWGTGWRGWGSGELIGEVE